MWRFGDNGLFSKSEEAVENHKIAVAREKLELTLSEASLDKETNPAYPQDGYLDKLIVDRIPGAEILGNIVVVDGYMFEIDRSVPKIGQYVAPKGGIKYPDVNATVTPSDDGKTATINITAGEDENGISKIEIILDGNVIKTIDYGGRKDEINETYPVTQNGNYTIKVYSNLSKSTIVEVNSLLMSVNFEPNGSSEWQKQYSVTLSVEETSEPITSIKYMWLEAGTGIDENSFTNAESCNNGDTIEFEQDEEGEPINKLTGQYYLWTMITTASGRTNVNRSNAFYFDNEGPVLNVTNNQLDTLNFDITISIVNDHMSQLSSIFVYVKGELWDSFNEEIQEKTLKMKFDELGEYLVEIVAIDSLGNKSIWSENLVCREYSWKMYPYVEETRYKLGTSENSKGYVRGSNDSGKNIYTVCKNRPSIDPVTRVGSRFGYLYYY